MDRIIQKKYVLRWETACKVKTSGKAGGLIWPERA